MKSNKNQMYPKNVFCINLDIRKDRRRRMEKQCKKLKIKFTFETVTLHVNPKRGCLESHYNIIFKNKNKPYVTILEDDLQFLDNFNIPEPPKDWDMIYLGGVEKSVSKYNKHYNKANNVLSTCGYLINYNCMKYVLKHLKDYPNEIDMFYSEIIQKKFNCYILSSHLVKQYADYSNIENANDDYSAFETKKIPFPKHTIQDDKFLINFDENIELPMITVITPTRNRRKFFELVLYNFNNFDYPKDKIEWIIVDDIDSDDISDILPKENNVHYIRKKWIYSTISEKRNYACSLANGEYIVHMDDDDIYFPDSITTKIKTLITNKKRCIGNTKFVNIFNKKSHIVGTINSPFSESSMTYHKSFWKENPFNEKLKQGEGTLFIKNREEECVQIPWYYNFISLTHNDNITKDLRKYDVGETTIYENLDKFYKEFIDKIYT